MKVEMPMYGPLPSVDHTRDRLLAKMFRFRQNEEDKVGATDEDFELLYAYGESSTLIAFCYLELIFQ